MWRTSGLFIAASVGTAFAATDCLTGWPTIVGSATKDGDTTVSTWSETPFVDNYLIGGWSNSADFTEREECASNGVGCAFLANWNKLTQDFRQKWVFTEAQIVLEIQFEPETLSDDQYFAVVFGRELVDVDDEESEYNNVITFNKWSGQRAEVSSIGYYINEPIDFENYEQFSKLSVFQNDRFHFVVNNPSHYQATDYFFVLTSGVVDSVHSEELNTASKSEVHLGAPTRKYSQGFGYDQSHIIQLATLTLPRGVNELGGVVTLPEAQTYQVVMSRSVTDIGTPFTYVDRYYATKQESVDSYYYSTHFTMSYKESSSGSKLGDVVLHTGGQHSERVNEIQISSYLVSESHALSPNTTKVFEMDERLKILSIGSDPFENLYDVYISYLTINNDEEEAVVGKVLFVNMLGEKVTTTYSFMPALQVSPEGNPITRRLNEIHQHGNYFYYAGLTNYMEKVVELADVDIDWTDTERFYGFFMVFTDSDLCFQEDRENLDYGSSFAVEFTGPVEEPSPRYYLQENTIKLPPNELNMGDMDDDDFARLERIEEEETEYDGFVITYRDWDRDDEDEDGNPYAQFMFVIDGDNWIDKFGAVRESNSYIYAQRDGNAAINIMGGVGLINSVYALYVWFTYLKDQTNSNFWLAWFSVCFTNGALWMPMTVLFPASSFGSSTMVLVFNVMAQLTYLGVYGAYWANLGAMYYTFLAKPTESGSTFTADSQAWSNLIGYLILSIVNSAITLLFADQIKDYYQQVIAADELEAAGDELSQSEESSVIVF